MLPVALTIAGSDPSGGAGLQADLKTFHQFGVYGEAVVTLLTVQNTLGVERVEPIAPELVSAQIRAVVSDIPPQAAKTGALGSLEVVEAVAAEAAKFPFPLIVDPVMFSKNGAELMDSRARRAFAKKLLPLAYLLTPNLAEASELAGFEVKDQDAMRRAAEYLVSLGAANVLVTGGHLEGEPVDVLFTSGRQSTSFRGGPRIESAHTHGTGCTFSAAIAAGLAQGLGITEAIANAQRFVRAAILTAPGLGSGCGPLNHFAK